MTKYKLFQVKDELTREYGFLKLSMLHSMGKQVDLKNNYDLVYQGYIEIGNRNALEILFEMFNTDYLDNFHGRSMSVSDVVEINNHYFYCDSSGWKEVEVNL